MVAPEIRLPVAFLQPRLHLAHIAVHDVLRMFVLEIREIVGIDQKRFQTRRQGRERGRRRGLERIHQMNGIWNHRTNVVGVVFARLHAIFQYKQFGATSLHQGMFGESGRIRSRAGFNEQHVRSSVQSPKPHGPLGTPRHTMQQVGRGQPYPRKFYPGRGQRHPRPNMQGFRGGHGRAFKRFFPAYIDGSQHGFSRLKPLGHTSRGSYGSLRAVDHGRDDFPGIFPQIIVDDGIDGCTCTQRIGQRIAPTRLFDEWRETFGHARL